MNCHEYQDWLQLEMDGEQPLSGAAVADHVAGCPACHALHASARRLRHGLLRFPRPTVSPELSARLVRRVLADRGRRQRWRMRLAGSVALAASLLLIVFAGNFPRSSPGTPAPERPGPVAGPVPSLRDTVAEAGSAFASLTTRAAGEAVGQSRVLLPVVDDSILPPMGVPTAPEAPAVALRETGQGMTAGLAPLTQSARRAVALFLRDLSPAPPGG